MLGRPGGPLGAFGGVGGVGPCGLCFGPLKSGGFNPPGSGCPPVGWGWVALGVALWRPVGSLGSFVASVLGLWNQVDLIRLVSEALRGMLLAVLVCLASFS